MKAEEATETLAKFFNDLVGAWVPGTVFAAGLAITHLGPAQLSEASKLTEGTGAALAIAGMLFALGHFLQATHEHVLGPALAKIPWIGRFDETNAKAKDSYKWFLNITKAQQGENETSGGTDWAFHDLRNVALSISSEAASLGRRFMFISLLCNGVATALLLLTIDFSACILLAPTLLYHYERAAPIVLQIVMLLISSLTLFRRGSVFYTRAMSTPFSIAVAELKFRKEANASKPSS